MDNLVLAKKVQRLASCFLYEENMQYNDAEQWKEIQGDLKQCMNVLVRQEGKSIEEEAELALALLMGNSISVRNSQSVARALERAERVLPLLVDPVLKCKLACFCYLEFPDEELLEMALSGIEEVKRQGRGEEILHIEKLLLDL